MSKEIYPGLEKVGNGKSVHHVTTEAYHENLFSQSRYMSKPQYFQIEIEDYKRLVITNHWMHCFSMCNKEIIKTFMER